MFHTVIVALGTLDELLSGRAINWPALCQLMKMLKEKVQALNVLWSFYSQAKKTKDLHNNINKNEFPIFLSLSSW